MHFEQLSKQIELDLDSSVTFSSDQKQALGITISVSTLKRFLKYDIDLNGRLDRRQLKTLDKLSIFIGYADWVSFSSVYYTKNQSELKTLTATMKALLQNAMRAEFETYQQLPTINFAALQSYFIPEDSAYKRIISNLQDKKKKNLLISTPFNPSTCDLIEFKIIKTTSTEIQIQTKEHWFLKWYEPQQLEVIETYNILDEQFYLIHKTSTGWKIKLNYYQEPSNMSDNNKHSLNSAR